MIQRLLVLVTAVIVLISLPLTANSKVIYVKTTGNNASDGLSWDTAKKTVTAGLGIALASDEIWVAAGMYTERISLKKDVALYGGFVGTETDLNQRNRSINLTILDGSKAGSVVSSPIGATSATRIDGFTIQNGYSSNGGGVYCHGSAPTIANNIIIGNSVSTSGAGIFSDYAAPIIINNIIKHNYGGGIYCTGTTYSPSITNNTIVENSSPLDGAGIYIDCRATVSNNIVAFNSSGIGRRASNSVPVLRNNDVYGNTLSNYIGTTPGEGDITADPKLIAGPNWQLHLAIGSACIDAGFNSAAGIPSVDIDGQNRTLNGTVDIGADESDGTEPVYTPWEPSKIVRVSSDGNDVNDGSTWSLAKRTVQAALNATTYGGEVWVKAGSYVERLSMKNGVALLGGFAGTETDRDQRDPKTNITVLDGNQTTEVIDVLSTTSLTRIDGFTIRNGKGNIYGGGIFCLYACLTVSNNVITGNKAPFGGGIYNEKSFITIEDNTITANTATSDGGGIFGYEYGSSLIKNNLIADNSATYTAGGISCNGPVTITGNTITRNTSSMGAGISIGINTIIIGNKITQNTAKMWGGAVYCPSGTSMTLSGNLIRCNTGFYAVYCESNSSATVASNAIIANGGGMYCGSSTSFMIANNTLIGNVALGGYPATRPQDGGGICCNGSATRICNNIVAFNGMGIYNASTVGAPTLNNNCVFGNTGYDYSGVSAGTGDISVDPGCAGADFGGFHLKNDSPCINHGTSDTGALPTIDIDGNVRTFDGIVDIGADEFDTTLPNDGPFTVIRVSPDGNDTNDGSNWTLPKKTLQSAIDAAAVIGGEVWAKSGTYLERIKFRPFTHLYGGFAGIESHLSDRDWKTNESIIDGGGIGPVVSMITLVGSTNSSCIDGFNVCNGTLPASNLDSYGGGIYCYCSSTRIANNTIRQNGTWDESLPYNTLMTTGGGGISSIGSNIEVCGNSISDNRAGQGGGIYCNTGTLTIRNNKIEGNIGSNGGGITCSSCSPDIEGNQINSNTAYFGGGIKIENSAPTVHSNVISQNHSDFSGGGICSSFSSSTILDNTIMGNKALYGAGVECEHDSTILANNNISGNSAEYEGTGIYCQSKSQAIITSNTIVQNVMTGDKRFHSGSGIYCYGASLPTISNNILCFNTSGIKSSTDSLPVIRNNDVFGSALSNYLGLQSGTGGISFDPLFVDRANGDYHLRVTSPCVNAGWNDASGVQSTDFEGEPRIQGGAIDIGADECWLKAASVNDTKRAADGILVDIDGQPITAAFPDYFYVENTDRSNGIRVDKLNHGLSEGQLAHVIGSIKTAESGERYIDATTADSGGSDSIKPLLMNNKFLGGGTFGLQSGVFGWDLVRKADNTLQLVWMQSSGLNNIGLLIKTFGRITCVGDGFFYVDDGSAVNDGTGHKGIKVYGTVPVESGEDPIGKFVTVTGISSCEKPGSDPIRIIRTRSADDIVIQQN